MWWPARAPDRSWSAPKSSSWRSSTKSSSWPWFQAGSSHKALGREPLCSLMRQALGVVLFVFLVAVAGCSQDAGQSSFGQLSDAEFRQPLPEPPLHHVSRPPAASTVLADVARSSMRSAEFQIVGTEQASRMQGQIGAEVYHQNGTLTIGPPALELQPLAD